MNKSNEKAKNEKANVEVLKDGAGLLGSLGENMADKLLRKAGVLPEKEKE